MLNLGGSVLGFSSASSSSVSKGETVADTIRIVSCYADIVAMRHPLEGGPQRAALYARVPVINAGDGGHQHPTQTLTDLVTIRRRLGRLDGLTVGLCGDLKYGRTVHSLIAALSRLPGSRFVCISPAELRLPAEVRAAALAAGCELVETADLEAVLPSLDVLYMTRIQRERFADPAEYERLKGCYVLTRAKLAAARPEMPVLHPLPRVDEITPDVDDDPRAAYFEQAQNGVYARMALMMTLLGLGPVRLAPGAPALPADARRGEGLVCGDRRCITASEGAGEHWFVPDADGRPRCLYCGRELRRG